MGSIATAVASGNMPPALPKRPNKLDRILAALDDDDRAIVLSWLLDDDLGEEELEYRLSGFDIAVSDSTIRRWRVYRRRSGEWDA